MFGRAARFAGRGIGRSAAPVLYGGAAAVGVGSAIMNEEGPYGTIAENNFGSRNFVRSSFSAGISEALKSNTEVMGPVNYYYGQHFDPGVRNRPPVSGDIVFGSYNNRRGEFN